MKKRSGLDLLVRISFIGVLTGGLLLFAITRRDVFARVGVTAAAIVMLLWLAFLAIASVVRKLRSRHYLDLFMAVLWNGGIMLLLTYFIMLLLWEMFSLRLVGPVSPPMQSKLAILGGSLILLGLVIALVAVPFRRKNASRQRENGDR
jgi:hypothetical protein